MDQHWGGEGEKWEEGTPGNNEGQWGASSFIDLKILHHGYRQYSTEPIQKCSLKICKVCFHLEVYERLASQANDWGHEAERFDQFDLSREDTSVDGLLVLLVRLVLASSFGWGQLIGHLTKLRLRLVVNLKEWYKRLPFASNGIFTCSV